MIHGRDLGPGLSSFFETDPGRIHAHGRPISQPFLCKSAIILRLPAIAVARRVTKEVTHGDLTPGWYRLPGIAVLLHHRGFFKSRNVLRDRVVELKFALIK